MHEIIERNIEVLLSIDSKIAEESIGGNANSWRGFGCSYLNFTYNSNTGEIVYIGNKPKATNAGIKLAFPAKQRPLKIWEGKDRIVKFDFKEIPTEEILKILLESAYAYNKKHAFNPMNKPVVYEGVA